MTHETNPLRIDLRSITRSGPGILMVVVRLYDHRTGGRHDWLLAGGAKLQWHKTRATLRAYLKEGATDFEHDSAFAFSLPLIGVAMDYECGVAGSLWFNGWIDPDPDGFRVPGPDYNPLTMKGSIFCTQCRGKRKHRIVPEMHYAGPPEVTCTELAKSVAGKQVEIMIYPWYSEE